MNTLERQFFKEFGHEWEAATPGFRLQAHLRGKKVADLAIGETYPYYDWASVTKIVFTASAFMFLHDAGRYRVTDRVSRWVPWFPEESPVRLKDLMSHSGGLTWWYPFYQPLSRKTGSRTKPEEAWEIFQALLKPKVLKDAHKIDSLTELKRAPVVYSDLDLFLLGIALESLTGTTLYTVWADICDRMGLRDTDFHRGNRPRHARRLYAPTEKDEWRGRVIQGEVHDENTWALRGVAPHSGLFGPIDDLSRWGLLLRKAMRGEATRNFASPETVKLFTKRSLPRKRGDWALLFTMPTKGGASCGPNFSLSSVGHLGFTGTSLWYDPERDLLVTILANRVHPTRENKLWSTWRPKLHTWLT